MCLFWPNHATWVCKAVWLSRTDRTTDSAAGKEPGSWPSLGPSIALVHQSTKALYESHLHFQSGSASSGGAWTFWAGFVVSFSHHWKARAVSRSTSPGDPQFPLTWPIHFQPSSCLAVWLPTQCFTYCEQALFLTSPLSVLPKHEKPPFQNSEQENLQCFTYGKDYPTKNNPHSMNLWLCSLWPL